VFATVPAGESWLLKNAMVWNDGVANDSVQVLVVTLAGVRIALAFGFPLAAHGIIQWNGFLIMKPGDTLQGSSSTSSSAVVASGARLPGVA
jgi:hypothetical protein